MCFSLFRILLWFQLVFCVCVCAAQLLRLRSIHYYSLNSTESDEVDSSNFEESTGRRSFFSLFPLWAFCILLICKFIVRSAWSERPLHINKIKWKERIKGTLLVWSLFFFLSFSLWRVHVHWFDTASKAHQPNGKKRKLAFGNLSDGLKQLCAYRSSLSFFLLFLILVSSGLVHICTSSCVRSN